VKRTGTHIACTAVRVSVRTAAAIAIFATASGHQVFAADPPPAPSQDVSSRHFDITAQALSSALRAYADLTGEQVVFFSEVGKNQRSTEVNGDFTRDQALTQLLKNTGLTFERLSSKTIAITSPNRATADHATDTGARSASTNAHLAYAAEETPASNSFVEKEEGQQVSQKELVALQEVVVTAQKREERLQDVPVPVSTLDADNLAATGQVLLRDYYSSVPGLILSPGVAGAQALSIRGIGGNGGGPTVTVMVDDAIYGGSTSTTGGGNLPEIDPGDLQRIEVLRGPQGTLYGADSMGGLVKFVTKSPSTAGYEGRIEATTNAVAGGAEPGYGLRGSANIPLSDTFAVRVSGFTRQDAGYINNPTHDLRGINEAAAYGGRLSALWRLSQNLSVKLSALYQDYKTNGASEVNLPTPGFPQTTGLGDLQQNYLPGVGAFDRRDQAYSAVLDYKNDYIDVTSVSTYNNVRQHDGLDLSYSFGPVAQHSFGTEFGGAPLFDHSNLSKFTQEIRLSGSAWSKMDWLVGGFYTHDRVPDVQTIYAENPSTLQIAGIAYNQSYTPTYQEYAGFGDLTFHLTDRFDVQIGGRETHSVLTLAPLTLSGALYDPAVVTPQKVSNHNTFTYLLTPRLKVSDNVMVYARLASGFRPGAPNGVIAGAPLQSNPDKTQNYELGVKANFFDESLYVDASVFYIDWNNIQLSLVSADGFGYTGNGSRAKSEGTELSITARPLTGLSISAWVSYEDAVLTRDFPPLCGAVISSTCSYIYGVAGDRLPSSAKFSGNLSLEQQFRLSNQATGFVGAIASYVGNRQDVFEGTPQRTYFPSYTKTDFHAGLKSGPWTTTVYVNNLANVRGLLAGGSGFIPPYAYVYIQPRTVGLSVAKTF